MGDKIIDTVVLDVDMEYLVTMTYTSLAFSSTHAELSYETTQVIPLQSAKVRD